MKVQKIAIAAGAGVAFLLCLAGLWVASSAYLKASKVKATLDGSKRKLVTIYDQNPFPNNTNVVVLRGDTAWMTNWYQSLVGELRAVAEPTENFTPSWFIKKLQDTSVELQKKASSEGGKVLPEGFAFGFGRYLGSKSEMPAPENVKRLALQFGMVETVTREILDSHVQSLVQVDREVFEGGGADVPAATPGGHRLAHHATPTAAPMAAAADSRYRRQHFGFTFIADEKALSEVLTRLAKLPLFVVVTQVRVDRVERGLKLADEAEKAAGAAAPPNLRIVSGPETAPQLTTQLQVDVYTFEGV